jgi:putative transposase
MRFIEGEIYHIYNRGNNRQRIFFCRDNYFFFLQKIQRHLNPYCDIMAYCLMPNHFHLLIQVKAVSRGQEAGQNVSKVDPLSYALGIILRSYTRAIQNQEHITGSLFQQKTKSRIVCDSSSNVTVSNLLICMNYIHQNPVRAALVKYMEDWEFSSYREYIELHGEKVCNKKLVYLLVDLEKDEFIEQSRQMINDMLLKMFDRIL